MLALEIAVVLLLIVLNGFFAMSELAIVSARPALLRKQAAEGRQGAATAAALAGDPGRFLSAVQVGITLVGILAGTFGGATLAERLGRWLDTQPAIAPYGGAVAIAAVVIGISYLTLILGELVPKQIALGNAERIAAAVARPVNLIARIASPAVVVLRLSTEAVLWLLPVARPGSRTVTEEEVRTMIAEGTEVGVFEPVERKMLEGVLKLADRSVDSVMTPRPDVVWLDLDKPLDEAVAELAGSGHARFPVSRGAVDEVVGVVQKKDLLDRVLAGGTVDLDAAMHPPLVVHESTSLLKMLELFREAPMQLAAVVDEYGSLQGIVTPIDILEAITGELWTAEADEGPAVVRRSDGSLLLSGMLAIDEALRLLELPEELANETDGARTLAGLVLFRLGRVPVEGDGFLWQGWRFEVVDMDGRRIDKLLLSRAAVPEG